MLGLVDKQMQVDSAQVQAIKLAESTLQLSNIDLAASYVLGGNNSVQTPVVSSLRNEIIGPAVSEAQVSTWFVHYLE